MKLKKVLIKLADIEGYNWVHFCYVDEELKEQFNIAISLGDDLVQNEVEKEAPAKSIYHYLDEFIKEESVLNQWAHATVQCWNTFKNHLLSFGKRLEFRDFNEKGLSRFVMHLRKHRLLLKFTRLSEVHDKSAQAFLIEITELQSLSKG